MKHDRIKPQPGQESVWDYPRPPRVEPVHRTIRVEAEGETLASSQTAFRVLETSHPPVFYVPPADVAMDRLVVAKERSFCEFKGEARYYALASDPEATPIAWFYPSPSKEYEALTDYLAFYPGRVDGCFVDDEAVHPQAGNFYGGWITADIVGPFKGAPGTYGW